MNELADRGMMRTVRQIYARAAQAPGEHADVLRCVRDAGLDNGDLEFALEAQRLLARTASHVASEWIALGEIEAAVGHYAEAEEALVTGLELDPANATGRKHLEALRADGVEACAPYGGFGSAPGRKLLRQQRRTVGSVADG